LVISQATHRLIEGYFDCRELGAHALRGLSQPTMVYQVLHESAARSRLEAAGTPSLTILTGRDKEIGLLKDRWQQTVEGMGQVVLLSGEAGIGKSRLVREIKAHVASNPEAWLTECYCSPYFQSTALYPIIDLFEHTVLPFEKEAPAAEKLKKLEGFLLQYGFALPETVPLFASLLNVPLSESYAPLNLTPERQKQKTLAALLNLLVTRASQQPILFIMEDLHWADPTSMEWLNLIIEQGPMMRCLTLLTFRPDFVPPWPMRSPLAYLTLSRLPRQEVENMAAQVAKAKALPPEVLAHIVSHTDGVPLFVEELIKTLLETGVLTKKNGEYVMARALTQLAIPATLRDSLMARLDRLGAAKEIAQLGATLGREFPYEWLQAVSPLEEAALQHELKRLVEAELLFRRGAPPQATYIFKHALIQEAAYESLLKSKRLQYHQQIAQTLSERFPETAETKPELLAHHYTNAGMKKEAITYWQHAGQRAMARSANWEAAKHLAKGLELLKTLPESPEQMQQELVLQLTYGMANIATKGYTATEVEQAFARAREICTQFGETPQLFPVLWGLWAFYIVRRDFQASHELGAQILAMAQAQQDAGLLLEAHTAQGLNFFYSNGDFTASRYHFEQGLALYDPQQHRSHVSTYIQDPGVVCRSHLSWILWYQGYPDQALCQSAEAITLAQAIEHLFSLGYAQTWAAVLYMLRREAPAAKKMSEEVIALAAEEVFPFWLADGEMIRGWALSQQDQSIEGLQQLRRGIATWKAMGASLWQTQQLGMLAEAHAALGQIQDGLAAVNEALMAVDKSEERYYEAELNRLKGELLLMQTAPEENQAEICFLQARQIARERKAKSLELRAAMSLSRLWQKQG
ncbi:MAG: AAA family ATPase, partial [candidate division KSB1 bacterium]|nr:AAA family ATPase [candidate division KSB1 bacterium]